MRCEVLIKGQMHKGKLVEIKLKKAFVLLDSGKREEVSVHAIHKAWPDLTTLAPG